MASQDGEPPTPGEHAPRVLVLDDDPGVLLSVCRVLERGGCDVTRQEDADRAEELLLAGAVDVAVLDVMLPTISGIDLLRRVKAARPRVAVVMMTASNSVQTAVEAVRAGAFDYLTKPFDSLENILLTVRRAFEHQRLIDDNAALTKMLEAKEGMEDLVGQSTKMREVFQLIDAVGPTPATVLIRGESGTGKELVARAIHRRSDRVRAPFLAVNCSALAESVLESELFGHVKGAFTGAMTNRKGLFEAAHGGTVFLDEIGDISPQTQVRLLRVLQEGEVKPIGSNQSITVDVRVLAATNANLEAAMRAKKFREDLYYRLNVVTAAIPPLRERPDDIMLLALHFLRRHGARMKRNVQGFSEEARQALLTHDWPGNVRELENAVARGVVMCTGPEIQVSHLPPGIGGAVAASDVEAQSLAHLPYAQAKKTALVAFERSYLKAKLAGSGGNISKAAREAGVDRSNFKRLLREYGVGEGGDGTPDEEAGA
ncbi:MAG: Fis family transcriptional regulator [Deltaproteobacteria bacterium RBG_16_71_12]|nr:MAG: Fis family transcriptional regulator [Deltaproteobacteria bacterium RBG_16_71_12]